MSKTKDYLAMRQVDPEDKVDHGVKGQKWGVSRSSSELKVAAVKRGGAKPVVQKTEPVKSSTTGVETSSDRYARLAKQAKEGKAMDMNEPDLKFFNSRTEALAKVKKMNESQGWLAKVSKKVIQQTAEKSLQAAADSVTTKYVTGPLLDSIKNAGGNNYVGKHTKK